MIDKLNNNTFRQTFRFLKRRDSVSPKRGALLLKKEPSLSQKKNFVSPKNDLHCSKERFRFPQRRALFLSKQPPFSQKKNFVSPQRASVF
ncbi:hypothetical protein IX307_000288 [Bacteroides pyogenes]|uniref:Uncharacterized protein n=1 Tax=Bacteroides pyogenes DSM 20611 = JCM 6294 TaxID=1121100 RepID=W4PD43_9BACE|nr:hypothetical protein [Bacteroides pyogenes]GAE17308.1 hypothetical protein JCM6294_36 [Bacteroides pyogenes DSM 20611 = JCM 6294]MBR8724833.1 hypothetical protein [Bacteroides pyogenes]MBR8738389.1 hypothetical protein [Bacteroides pyogenes]MBR8754061.1 hypothetical protein [Bacteroides pyogenes]